MKKEEQSTKRRRTITMTPFAIAIERVITFWVRIWRAWRLTLDWTVQLYLLLPAIWVACGTYRSWWRYPPEWLGHIPVTVVLVLLAILMLRGRLRTFAYKGDALFLRTNGSWIKRMTAVGLAYTLIMRLILAAAAGAVMLPLFRLIYGWEQGLILLLLLCVFLLGGMWTLLRDNLERRWTGWRRTAVVLISAIFILAVWTAGSYKVVQSGAGATALLGLGLLVLYVPLAINRLGARGTFVREIANEDKAYEDCLRIMLKESGAYEKVSEAKRPWLFPRSGKLFRKRDEAHRIAELWLRVRLRHMPTLRTLLSFIGVGTTAIWLSPVWANLLLWLSLLLLLNLWLQAHWVQWLEQRFISLFVWDEARMAEAEEKALIGLSLPAFLYFGCIIGLHIGWGNGGAWWGASLLLPLIGFPTGKEITRRMAAFANLRRLVKKSRKAEGNPEIPRNDGTIKV